MDHWQGEAGCFAGSGLCNAQNIFSGLKLRGLLGLGWAWAFRNRPHRSLLKFLGLSSGQRILSSKSAFGEALSVYRILASFDRDNEAEKGIFKARCTLIILNGQWFRWFRLFGL